MQLDCYWHQVPASFHIKQTKACAHVSPFQILPVLTIVGDVLQDFIIYYVDPTSLLIIKRTT